MRWPWLVLLAVAGAAVMLDVYLLRPKPVSHGHCVEYVMHPSVLACADGGWLVENGHWQFLGPLSPVPGIPR